VIAKEIEKFGIPVSHVTAITIIGKQVGVSRVVSGSKVPHPCGDPLLSDEADHALRRAIIECALDALETDVEGPTVFIPKVTLTPS